MSHIIHNLFLLSALTLTIYAQQQQPIVPPPTIQIDQKPTIQPEATPIVITTIGKTSQNPQEIMEIQQENKLQQDIDEQLPVWIEQELHQTRSVIDLPITQSFSFILKSGEETVFKWDPSKQKQLKLIVDVFYLTPNGALSVITDAQQSQYLQITVKNPDSVFYGLIGKVYRSKIITVDFDTDYKYLKFDNKNSQTVYVDIDIEKLQFVVEKGVPDDKLTISRNKVNSIITESKSTEVKREHLYKWQWGFYQNEKNHQAQMLGLTGVELFTILSTACIQMYCLKGLLDNRAVV